ncbi:hypothetical protein LCGC14_2139680, partial [marine sediment metagenome]
MRLVLVIMACLICLDSKAENIEPFTS